jgi:hypothetical protein
MPGREGCEEIVVGPRLGFGILSGDLNIRFGDYVERRTARLNGTKMSRPYR